MNPTPAIRSTHVPTQKLLLVPLVISTVPSSFCLVMGHIMKRRNFTRFPMPDQIIKKTNAWDKKTKRLVYENVIEFKERCKNPYQWDPKDDMYGLLEDPKPHETSPIPAEFPGV